MPIRQDETPFNAAQYEALMYQTEDPVWQVVAHRLNLDFRERIVSGGRKDFTTWDGVTLPNFGCIAVMMNMLITFYPEHEGDLVPNNITPSINYSVYAPSLFYDETNSRLYIFAATATALTRYEYSIQLGDSIYNGAYTYTLGLAADETITQIAAVSTERVHYGVKNNTRNTYNLRVSDFTGNIASRIHYQYPIQSLAAVAFNGENIVAVATQTPGMISQQVTDDQVTKYIEHSGGLLAWLYKEGTWSDHYGIDIVDNISNNLIRRHIRMSVTHDRITITAFAATGTAPFAVSSYRLYTSKDGKHWSLGQIMALDSAPTGSGLKILTLGAKVFAFDFGGLYESDCTFLLGYSAPHLQVDITNDIADYTLTNEQAKSASITLENEDGVYDSHPIINSNNSIMLEHYTGYRVPNENDPLLVLIARTEVDTLDFSQEGADRTLSMVSRDVMAWMSDKFASENAEYWESQLVGADNYIDETATQYGGLGHTAVQSGSWQSNENVLELRSDNKEGIAFSTHNPFIWNGSYEARFKLASASGTEYAGIVFRALNKDNLWAAIYEQATDKIHLKVRRGGTDTILQSTATMGWSSDVTNYKHLRVEFYYASIRVLYSTDGIHWIEAITHIADGSHAVDTTGTALLDKGFVGQIGSGYHEASTWSLPTFTFPEFTFPAFNFNLPINLPFPLSSDPTPDSSDEPGIADRAVLVTVNQQSGSTDDYWSVTYDFANEIIGFTDLNYDGAEAASKWKVLHDRGSFSGGLYRYSPLIELNFGSINRIDTIKVVVRRSTTAWLHDLDTSLNIGFLRSMGTSGGAMTLQGPSRRPANVNKVWVSFKERYGTPTDGGIRYVQIWGYGPFIP